jgi:hypothetical protein
MNRFIHAKDDARSPPSSRRSQPITTSQNKAIIAVMKIRIVLSVIAQPCENDGSQQHQHQKHSDQQQLP